ncbi:hypothetical protein NXV73_16415 [Bacteroides salyersiae]|nr:hypothetical protein [Bacteroides salyersiae]
MLKKRLTPFSRGNPEGILNWSLYFNPIEIILLLRVVKLAPVLI